MTGAVIVKDTEDIDYVLGILILNGKSIDIDLFETRVSEMYRELCYDEEEDSFSYDEYDAEAVINEVLKRYDDYAGMVYTTDFNVAYA